MSDTTRLPAEGTTLAQRYRIERLLGKGGMGAVYRAFDDVVGEAVALKLMLSHDPTAIARFREELLLARRVTHKHIGRTFDLGRDGGRLFITMELVTGASLREILRARRSLPPADVGLLLGQVARGLAAAHEVEVVHRDLKPSNVLVASSGRVVLIDFGVSASQSSPTEDGALFGTFDYMSPEQARAAPAHPSHDVYALGCVAFELATGRFPFHGEDALSRLKARLDGPPDLSGLEHGALRALIAECLHRDPSRRPLACEAGRRLDAFAGPACSGGLVGAPPSEPAPDDAATVATPYSRAPSLVVLPILLARGEDEAFGLGRAISEEVAEALRMTKGLRVMTARGATGGAAPSGADFVVAGDMSRAEDGGIHLTARLERGETGEILWAAPFDVQAGGVAALASAVAMRVAEALRLELEVLTAGEPIPGDAALAFLEGQRALRAGIVAPVEAMGIFDRCLALAPDFAPAIAARAIAVARALHLGDDEHRDWSAEARRSVERALAVAPLSPDAHLAEAVRGLAEVRWADGVRALYRVLALAPTHALAHEILGRVECEAGQSDRGVARLELALGLDPGLATALCQVARAHALRGRLDDFDRTMERIRMGESGPSVEALMLEARVAVWYRDADRARRVLARLSPAPGSRSFAVFVIRAIARLVAGDSGILEMRATEQTLNGQPHGPRLRSTILQNMADLEARFGDPDRAVACVELSLATGLIDVEWLERSPALDPLRDEEEFRRVAAQLRRRVATLWRSDLSAPPVEIRGVSPAS